MVLGPKILLKLVKGIKLVENLCSRELSSPEGAGFDIRIAEAYKISGRAFLGQEERKTPKEKLVCRYSSDKSKNGRLIVKPGEYYLIKTIESVNLPTNISCHIYPRSTLYRSGILFLCTQASPGYCGQLVFGLCNLAKTTVEIEMGARVCHLQFFEVKGGGSVYRGQWQGGRVSAKKREKQV